MPRRDAVWLATSPGRAVNREVALRRLDFSTVKFRPTSQPRIAAANNSAVWLVVTPALSFQKSDEGLSDDPFHS